jgi:phage-related protein
VPDTNRPIVWLKGTVSTPPFSRAARREAGFLLRCLQQGRSLSLPHSRPMPGIGQRVQELRIPDEGTTWRIICRCDADAIVIGAVFAKSTRRTPQHQIEQCRRRFRAYDDAARE